MFADMEDALLPDSGESDEENPKRHLLYLLRIGRASVLMTLGVLIIFLILRTYQ